MRFQPGAISLSAISGGTLASGVVPFARFTRDFQQQENPGNVVVTGSATVVNAITLTGAIAGDRILVVCRFRMYKGVTPGLTTHEIHRSAGPGVVNFMLEGAYPADRFDPHAASKHIRHTMTHFAEVTTGGDITLTQYLASMGSDGGCGPGLACVSAWLFAGS